MQQVGDLVHKVVSLMLDHLANAAHRPPLPVAAYRPQLPLLTDSPIPEPPLLGELKALLEASMNPAQPGYIGHMDSLPTTVSFLGDLAASAINNNLLSLEMSPALSRLEQELASELARAFGLGQESGGMLVSGGTLANWHALAVARNRAFRALHPGIVGLPQRPVILASGTAHASIAKTAMLLGLGTQGVFPVATDANSRMDCTDLERQVQQATADGRQPFAVVATAGSTTPGSIDPLAEVAQIARRHGLWLHVDAAYAGALIFSDTGRQRLHGIEQADSITFNPQKCLYVAKTCALVLYRTCAAPKASST